MNKNTKASTNAININPLVYCENSFLKKVINLLEESETKVNLTIAGKATTNAKNKII
jgi:hypothetical protein